MYSGDGIAVSFVWLNYGGVGEGAMKRPGKRNRISRKQKSTIRRFWDWICLKAEKAARFVGDFFRAAGDAASAAAVPLSAIKHDPNLAHAAVAVVKAVVPEPARAAVGVALKSGARKIIVVSNKLHFASISAALTKVTAASSLTVGTGALAAIGIVCFIGGVWLFFRVAKAAKVFFDIVGGVQGLTEQMRLLGAR